MRAFEFRAEDDAGAELFIDRFVYVSPRSDRGREVFQFSEHGVPWLTRAQMHKLYDAIGEALGMSSPAPSSPMTASHPASGGAKASRNLRPVS